jgi:hypothetical protein
MICLQADVETKLLCARASPVLRKILKTEQCWPQEVRLDLRDPRQLKWLHKHIAVRVDTGGNSGIASLSFRILADVMPVLLFPAKKLLAELSSSSF